MKTFSALALLAIGCGDSTDKTSPNGTSPHDDTAGADSASPDDTGNPDETGEPPVPEDAMLVMLSVPEGPDWTDMAFLAAIPATAQLNGGTPAVLAIENMSELKPGTRDLIDRLGPETVITTDGTAIDTDGNLVQLTGADAQAWSIALAGSTWDIVTHAVVVGEEDYSAGILGASLAALLDAPLLIAGSDIAGLEAFAADMGALMISVGVDQPPPELTDDHVDLSGTDAVIGWLNGRDIPVNYLAVTNTNDRASGRSQKASMMAPMYAANRGGLSIPLTIPMPTEVVEDGGDHPVLPILSDIYAQLGAPPEHLAIIGAHDALPQMRKPTIFDNPLSEQPVSDLPYAQTDDDAFIDIGIGRVVGDTLEELATIATRTAQYDRLMDGTWERNIVEAGLWGFDELRALNVNVDFEESRHLTQSEIETAGSLEIAAFLHKDHSYCQVLGHAVDINTPTLFAPAITVSRGCSVGGMDLLRDDQRSIVDHLFGQGIVAFVGAARNAIAYNTIIEVSLWNQLLEGRTLGQSFKHGINDAIVHWLDDGSSAMRYSIDTEIVYGDPAFRLHVPGPYQTEPAGQDFDGSTLTVTAPEEWTVVAYHPDQLAEWGYSGDLFMYTAPGAIPRTYWAGSYDNEDMYFGVQLHLDEAPASVTQTGSYPSPLGWGGSAHIDHHADGTASALWRVRLLDFDPVTGVLRAEQSAFTYAVD